jgi:hypothetical protein
LAAAGVAASAAESKTTKTKGNLIIAFSTLNRIALHAHETCARSSLDH